MARRLAEMERVLKALADVTRLRILELLRDREVCVCHIHESLRISQPKASRHLAYLRRAGLVATRRQGLWVYYRLAEMPDPIAGEIREAVTRGLSHLEAIQKDAARLQKRIGCCEEPAARGVPAAIIEKARPDDARAILRLLEQNRLPEGGVADRLATTIVARRSGVNGRDLAGTAALEMYAPDALLRSVAVDAALRGQGLGHELTTAALEMARQHGVSTVYLLTTTAGFFPRFGFIEVARDDVPAAIRVSEEFTSACPSNATAMRKVL
jgi:N-acetylglutamate synthase-like GNAT family acetyltransferase/DNA-binding transcriptional ArsR family regulator